MWSRRLFAAGAWVLIALGLAHLLWHYSLVTQEAADETHRRLLELMRGYQYDFGHNFHRSTMEFLAGLSLAFSVLTLGFGLLDLLVLRHSTGWAPLLHRVAAVNAGVFGILTPLALRYGLPAPFLFLAAAFLCFVTALGASPHRA
jgi:hypothetical protein